MIDFREQYRTGRLIAKGFRLGETEMTGPSMEWWEDAEFDLSRNAANAYGTQLFGVRVFQAAGLIDMPGTASPSSPKTKRGGLDFRSTDQVLLCEMERLIRSGKASSAFSAGLALAERASGRGTPVNRARRLAKRYNESFGSVLLTADSNE